MINVDCTILDFASILFQRLNVPSVTMTISGDVYKDERPANSTKEDVVINGVASDMEMIQRSVLNVNAYVPNKQGLPDHTRLYAVTQAVKTVILEGYGDDYGFYVESVSQFKEDASDSYFMNFRIRLTKHNTN